MAAGPDPWRRLFLRPGQLGLETAAPPADERVSYPADGAGITFTTEPMPVETEVTGPAAARLFVSSTTTDADLFLVLRLFGPDGGEITFPGAIDPHTPLAQGWLRLSHRKLNPTLSRPDRPYHAHDEIQPLTPGAVYQADVEIWPTSVIIPVGCRLALTVRGRDYERRFPAAPRIRSFRNEMRGCGPFLHDDREDRPASLATSTQTLWTGGTRPAFLLLPVIPPG